MNNRVEEGPTESLRRVPPTTVLRKSIIKGFREDLVNSGMNVSNHLGNTPRQIF